MQECTLDLKRIYKGSDLQEGDSVIYSRPSNKGLIYPDEPMKVTINQISMGVDAQEGKCWMVGWHGYDDKDQRISGYGTLKNFQKRVIEKL